MGLHEMKEEWHSLTRWWPGKSNTRGDLEKAGKARRKFLAAVFGKLAGGLKLKKPTVHELGPAGDAGVHKAVSKVFARGKYVMYEHNPGYTKLLKKNIRKGLPVEYRGDFHAEATDDADLVVCSYPFDEEDVFSAAAKHLKPGKFFALAAEPFGVGVENNRKHYDKIARENQFEPVPLPQEVEELHSEGTFYIGLYSKR
ncbi:MAG: class I SAM-dependent methyltransferase [Candidatus Diapherotrites archaeon]|nr:class I SAM-dependent methyltransferase [Candidatus Diapherotrites archaeon]